MVAARKKTAPRRKRYAMPASVSAALKRRGLQSAYRARPPYQRNDYLMWIAKAKLPATQQQRLTQMLAELRKGDVYMKMKWQPRNAKRKSVKKVARK